MRIPSPIQDKAQQGLEGMLSDPTHHFDWRIRREIYQLFAPSSDPIVLRARRLLPILAAEHVLPIFSSHFPKDDLPRRLINTAMWVTAGGIEPEDPRVYRVADEGYHATGGGIAFDYESGKLIYNADYAAFSAYKCLVEIHGLQDPWIHADKFHKSGGVFGAGGDLGSQGWTSGNEFTDRDWAGLAAAGDTAAAAAMAEATSEHDNEPASDKLRQFWTW
jgi:hypothetical protein